MKIVGLEAKYHEAVELASKHLNLKCEKEIRFEKADCLHIYNEDEAVVVKYSEICEIYRGLSFVDRVAGENTEIKQKSRVSTRGTVADCCRNGVLNVESVKELIITVAIMGYNFLGLYLEDIYEIEEYPYFGHKRGAYTKEELKFFVEFAGLFGIDLTIHIQTLGHLSIIQDWKCFQPLFDTRGVLMADEESTYEFIENEIKALRDVLTCDILFIGMDEAYNMGRGKYLEKHGYVDNVELFIRHLNRVCQICEKYNFRPVIPTDTLIRFSTGGYWSKDATISKEICDKLNKSLIFEYWDYYFQPSESDIIDNMCKIHVKSGFETWYICGAWNWHGLTPKNYYSNFVTPNQCELAIKNGINAIVDATFGDDGAECPIFAVLPAILKTAELLYDSTDEEELNKRSLECLGLPFDDFMKIDAIGVLGEEHDFLDRCPSTVEKSALYNDIMLGLKNANFKQFNLEGKYAKDAEILRSVKSERYGLLFDTQAKYADFLEINWHLSLDIKKAYKEDNKEELKNICDNVIPKALEALEVFEKAFNKQWHKYYKPFGFEVQQLRIGGILLRFKDTRERIYEYLNGEISRLEELECEDLIFEENSCGIRGSQFWRLSFTRNDIGW